MPRQYSYVEVEIRLMGLSRHGDEKREEALTWIRQYPEYLDKIKGHLNESLTNPPKFIADARGCTLHNMDEEERLHWLLDLIDEAQAKKQKKKTRKS